MIVVPAPLSTPDFVRVRADASVMLTLAGAVAVAVVLFGPEPVTEAVLVTVPALTSAWVSGYVAVAVTD